MRCVVAGRAGPGEPERLRGAARHALRRHVEQPLARAVHQAQLQLVIEREDGDLDLLHHLAQQRRRLERAEPLLAQRLAERVHLEHGQAQRVVGGRAARPDRVVALQQCGQQVGQRLQRPHHPLPQREREAEPEADTSRPNVHSTFAL
jgi:hypothetical protein